MNRETPPANDEFEISVIGPGRGECIVLHLGDNVWCIVDSCVSRGQSESVAIEYLDGFKNGALDGVKLVVATHWHDDHVRGLTSILKRVPKAEFYYSAALRVPQFIQLVRTYQVADPAGSGTKEFGTILQELEKQQNPNAQNRINPPKQAVENRRLLSLQGNGRSFPAAVTALSPSDATHALATLEFARLLPKPGQSQRRITGFEQNHTSVVLLVEAGPVTALLGADLLHTLAQNEGWNAVLACHANHHNQKRASFFKVPHHGSENADCPEVWTRLLTNNSIAVVTPFVAGVRLPKSSDLKRIGARTDELYCTTSGTGTPPKRDSVVERFMRQQITGRRLLEGLPGHVRVRWPSGQTMPNVVERFNGAFKVNPTL